jgi:hypothetical protein
MVRPASAAALPPVLVKDLRRPVHVLRIAPSANAARILVEQTRIMRLEPPPWPFGPMTTIWLPQERSMSIRFPLAEAFLARAEQLEPANPTWPANLEHLRKLHASAQLQKLRSTIPQPK